MDYAVTIVLGIVQLAFAGLGIYVSIKPQPENRHAKLIAAFICLGFVGIGVTVWQQARSSAHEAELVLANKTAITDAVKPLNDQLTALRAQVAVVDTKIGGTKSPRQPTPSPPITGKAIEDRILSMSIDGANIATPSGEPGKSEMALIVAITNSSRMATVANNYHLEVTTPDGVKHDAVFLRLGSLGNLHWTSASGIVTTIPASDALEDKTENHEILPGGTVRGRLLFILPDVSHDQAINPMTKLTLSAKDSKGISSFASDTIEAISKR